jgi:hypothetical protein
MPAPPAGSTLRPMRPLPRPNLAALLAALGLLVACPSTDPAPSAQRPDGPTVLMDFGAPGFFDAPFPSVHRIGPDGLIPLDGFPTLQPSTPFVDKLIGLVDGTLRGFGTTSAVAFRLESSPTSLPSLAESVTPDSPVFLVGLDGPDAGLRVPISVSFAPDGGPYGAIRLLTLLPLQGRPLHPATTYAAVVTRSLPVDGGPLGQSPALWSLRTGELPPGLGSEPGDAYLEALHTLADLGVDGDAVAGLAVFTTQDPTAELLEATSFLRAAQLAPAPLLPFTLTDVYDTYCVFRTVVEMPVLQTGAPPFSGEGGEWAWTRAGTPEVVGMERARLDVTIPRAAAPTAGFPTAVFIRTGGGADRALIDRGVRDEDGVAVPGTGVARDLAAIGFAGVEVDGPQGGLRNVSASDEQFLMFNMTNPVAMRDNVRQSAVELALLPPALATLRVPTADCPGAPPEGAFDVAHLALIGHSMGATIAPLALAAAPEFGALVLSGAGGSWIANIVHKELPFPVRPVADSIVGYTGTGRTLQMHDPLLSLLQWGGESADPPVYARVARASGPRHVLMVQGIVDHYILPPMANTTSLSLGLDLGGDALDGADPRLDAYATYEELAALSESAIGRADLPLAGNRHDGSTGVVVQVEEDPIEDGHEVFFQLPGPKEQLRAFLEAFAADQPPPVPDVSR